MTTHHHLTIGDIGVCWEDRGSLLHDGPEGDRRRLRSTVAAVSKAGAVAWVYARSDFLEEPVAAIIPAALAAELIAEGRLRHPVLSSQTVVR